MPRPRDLLRLRSEEQYHRPTIKKEKSDKEKSDKVETNVAKQEACSRG